MNRRFTRRCYGLSLCLEKKKLRAWPRWRSHVAHGELGWSRQSFPEGSMVFYGVLRRWGLTSFCDIFRASKPFLDVLPLKCGRTWLSAGLGEISRLLRGEGLLRFCFQRCSVLFVDMRLLLEGITFSTVFRLASWRTISGINYPSP